VATLKRRLRRRGEGVPDGTAGEAAALDPSHQTLAKPEPRRDSAETGRCAAAALAEWGSTTGPPRGPGAEGGHCPARFYGYGHHEVDAENVNQQVTGSDGQNERPGENPDEARRQQDNSDKTKSVM